MSDEMPVMDDTVSIPWAMDIGREADDDDFRRDAVSMMKSWGLTDDELELVNVSFSYDDLPVEATRRVVFRGPVDLIAKIRDAAFADPNA